MSKHIKGPLQVGYEFDETGYPLFVVAGLAGDQKRDRESLEATAKLFAAAPELLQALIDLGDWLAYGMNKAAGAEPTAEDHATCARVAAKARAAIDKATK